MLDYKREPIEVPFKSFEIIYYGLLKISEKEQTRYRSDDYKCRNYPGKVTSFC